MAVGRTVQTNFTMTHFLLTISQLELNTLASYFGGEAAWYYEGGAERDGDMNRS